MTSSTQTCNCQVETPSAAELMHVAQLPVIEERLRSLKEATEQRVAEAMQLVCSDETLAAVKNVRAELNRDFTEYETQRKAVKAAIMAPYYSFETIYADCVSAPFKQADLDLKTKIDATEHEIKNRCEEKLRTYFQELCAVHHVDFLTFEQTALKVDMVSAKAKTPKKLMEKLRMMVEGCAQTMSTIDAMEYGDEIAVEYKKCLDLPRAIQLVTERHQKLEAERQRKAETIHPTPAAAEPIEAVTPVPKRVQKAAVESVTCTFTVTDTRERLKLLKNFLDSNGYRYD